MIVEAKRVDNPESSDRVIGQLLKYYARALRIGEQGLAGLRRYAQRLADGEPRESPLISTRMIFGASSQAEAHRMLEAGRPLRPRNIKLVVALDEFRDKHAMRLGLIVRVLSTHHRLPIELLEVGEGRIKRCPVADERLYRPV